MKRLLLVLSMFTFLSCFSCSPLHEERVVNPPYDPNIKLDVRPAPPPSREEGATRIPEYQQSTPPWSTPSAPDQMSECSLVIYNQTVEEWEVLVNGTNMGLLNKWSTGAFQCGCDRVSVELHSGFPNFKTMHKAFYPNERQGNDFTWRLYYR
jgi:hypothetical protein